MEVILLAPAGSFESLEAALQNGADAVYFGAGELNMRARAAANFSAEDLPEIVRRCRTRGAEAWLALNTIIYDEELEKVRALCRRAKETGVDAVIAMDPAVIRAAREAELPVHLSVQANAANIESVRFYAQYADVIVLARELSLEQIARICNEIREQEIRGPSGELIRIEVFVHGALCVAVSGKCYMSLAEFNHSANRGECFQSCRRSYTVRDTETGAEFAVDNRYVMSPKDLCTIEFLGELLDSGASILKIEGRGRSADYVAETVAVYRESGGSLEIRRGPKSGAADRLETASGAGVQPRILGRWILSRTQTRRMGRLRRQSGDRPKNLSRHHCQLLSAGRSCGSATDLGFPAERSRSADYRKHNRSAETAC